MTCDCFINWDEFERIDKDIVVSSLKWFVQSSLLLENGTYIGHVWPNKECI